MFCFYHKKYGPKDGKRISLLQNSRNKGRNINFCKKAAVLAWMHQLLNFCDQTAISVFPQSWRDHFTVCFISKIDWCYTIILLASCGKSLPLDPSPKISQLPPIPLSSLTCLTSWIDNGKFDPGLLWKWLGLLTFEVRNPKDRQQSCLGVVPVRIIL